MRPSVRDLSRPSLFWPTLATAIGLLVLIALGTWQLERKAWKDGLIVRIQQGTRAEPLVLDAAETLYARGESMEYARVRARGRLHVQRTRYLFAPDARGTGWHAYTPLETAAGAVVLVNRGHLTDDERKAGLAELPADGQRETEVVGLLRAPGRDSYFTPASDPARNIWHARDLTGMTQSAFPGGVRRLVPFVIDAEAQAQAQGQPPAPAAGRPAVPRGGTTRLVLPNRHLEYALTWYGLAASLFVVYAAFAWQRVRLGRRRTLLGRGT